MFKTLRILIIMTILCLVFLVMGIVIEKSYELYCISALIEMNVLPAETICLLRPFEQNKDKCLEINKNQFSIN